MIEAIDDGNEWTALDADGNEWTALDADGNEWTALDDGNEVLFI